MLLKFTPLTGPKNWTFVDPDTSFKYEANDLKTLCNHIRNYRKQNELQELEFLEAVVENYLCKLKENIGACEPAKRLKRGVFQSIRGGIALLQTMMFKSFATQETADARSKVCSECPLNEFPDKGAFILWSDNLAKASIGNRKSKYHDALGNCSGCSCPMRPKVFWNGKIKLSPEELKTMSEANPNCWQVRELNNV